MNHYGRVVIGFGNMHGETSQPIMSEQRSRIQITNLKATMRNNPRVQVKKLPGIDLGALKNVIGKKRNEQVLQELLKVNLDSDLNQIETQCYQTQEKIQSDLGLVKALIDESKQDTFLQKTGGNLRQAQKYLQKYSSLDKAVQMYKEHQQKIEKFMKSQQCSRDVAKSFLQDNDYNVFE